MCPKVEVEDRNRTELELKLFSWNWEGELKKPRVAADEKTPTFEGFENLSQLIIKILK